MNDLEQLQLVPEEPGYFLDHRAYCGTWEVRVRSNAADRCGWGLKEFNSKAKALDGLRWLEADHRAHGHLRRLYPPEAPWAREHPHR